MAVSTASGNRYLTEGSAKSNVRSIHDLVLLDLKNQWRHGATSGGVQRSDFIAVIPTTGDAIVARDESETRARRNKCFVLTAKAGVLSKCAQIGTRLFTVPLSMRLLGPERYGIWLTVGAMLSWLSLSNLGFTSGVLNSISAAYANNDRPAIRRIASTAVVFFAVISVLLVAAMLVLSRTTSMYSILGLQRRGDGSVSEVRALILTSGLLFIASFLLSILGTVCSGLQEGYFWSLATTAAPILALFLLLGAALLPHTSLPVYAATQSGPTVVACGLVALYYFLRRHPDLAPLPRFADLDTLREIGRPSLLIFASQIGDTAVHYSGNVIISGYLGPASVPRYAVPYSLFMLAQSLCFNVLQPLWPAYAEALASGDHAWIRRTVNRTLRWSMLAMGGSGLGIVLLGRPVIRIWAGEAAVPSLAVLVLLAFYFEVWMVGAVFDNLACGLGRFRLRVVTSLLTGGVFLAGSLALVGYVGLAAPPIAGLCGNVISVTILSVCLRGAYRVRVA